MLLPPGITEECIEDDDRSGDDPVGQQVQHGFRRGIPIAVDVNEGTGFRVFADKGRKGFIKPAFDQLHIASHRGKLTSGGIHAPAINGAVFRKTFKADKAVNRPRRTMLRDQVDAAARVYAELEQEPGIVQAFRAENMLQHLEAVVKAGRLREVLDGECRRLQPGGPAHETPQIHAHLAGRLLRRVCGVGKPGGHLRGQVSHAHKHPVPGAGLVVIPPVDRQQHLIRRRAVTQRPLSVLQPQQLFLSAAPADVRAEADQRLVNHIPEGIGCLGIRGALDGDGTLIVRLAGAAPASVLLLDIEGDASVPVDAVVRACLALDVHKPVAQILRRPLADHAVRRDPVDAERSEAGMIRAQFCIHHHRAVCICHDASPPFAAGVCNRCMVPQAAAFHKRKCRRGRVL